ncbi:MAG: anti-sigma factor family protein, partial [Burkholderiales bacterium]
LVLLGLVTGFAAGWQLHATRLPAVAASDSPAFVRRAALAHATYTPEVRHAVEVGADQEAHLVAWLSKRLGAPVRAPKLDAADFSLVGGRLLPSESSPKGGLVPTAQFMYQNAKGMRVTLYVRSEVAGNTETAFRFAAEGNVKVFYWIDRRFGYALSSADLGKDDLLKVADAVYRQLNP